MFKDNYIILQKVAAAESPLARTPLAEEFVPGGINIGVSVPIDYEVQGVLMEDVTVGCCLSLFRTHRNGVQSEGVMSTSPIVSIDTDGEYMRISTANSIYHLYQMTATPASDELPC